MVGPTPARIGSAAAVLRRVVEGSRRRGADRALSEGKITGVRPRPPSRPRGTRRARGQWPQPRPSARSCVQRVAEALGQADLRGPRAGHGLGRHTYLAFTNADADVGAVLVGPGRFTELAPQMGIAGPGDRAPPLGEARRVLPGHQAGEAHEGSGLGKATPVEHLGGETQRTDSGHAPVGGQPLHLVAEGVLLAPREEVCLDRLEAGVSQLHGGQVVRVGGRDGGSSKDTVASQRR